MQQETENKKLEIKDYLPFYLGCRVVNTIGKDMGILASASIDGTCVINPLQGFDPRVIQAYILKPMLRPLSNITTKEARQAATFAFGSDEFRFTPMGYGFNLYGHRIHNSVKCYLLETFFPIPGACNGWYPTALLQIDTEDNDIIISKFEDQGRVMKDDMIEKPFELTRYLLSQHFDLFGLIPAGLAISKTKQEVPS